MSPSPRTLAKGITQAKPPSGMQALYGWRRVMRDCDRHVPDMQAAARVLKGMIEQLKRDFGQDAMTVDHHIPYPLQSVLRAVRYLDNYSCPTWTVVQHDAMRVTIKFNLSRGPRLDEWCEMHLGDSFYRRANFVWCQATEIIGDAAVVQARGIAIEGLLVRVINVPSKTDRSGVKWAGRHMWYRANSSNPLSFGTEWALWEARYPCPPELRRQWPAFSPTGNAEPFKPAKARAMLSLMWTAVEGAAFAALHAWHDFRATIASALTGAKHAASVVQAVVCWASQASVELYGQMSPDAFADAVEVATSTDAARHAHLPVPHTSNVSIAQELDLCLEAMTGGAHTRANKRARDDEKLPGLLHPLAVSDKLVLKRKAPEKPAMVAPTVKLLKPRSAPIPSPAASRGRCVPAALPPPLLTTATTYDVGPPLGRVSVPLSDRLDGTRVHVPNSAWVHNEKGSTWCILRGFANQAVLGEHKGVYVLEDESTGVHYPFTKPALWPHLTKALKAKSTNKQIKPTAPLCRRATLSPSHSNVPQARPHTPTSSGAQPLRRSPRASRPPQFLHA